jgi:hypothetical protein
MHISSIDQLSGALTFPWGVRESKTTDHSLSEAESSLGMPLSSEYAAFCRRFGAGELVESYYIAAPGYFDDHYRNDLVLLNRKIHERDGEEELKAVCAEIDRFQRLVFFCQDIRTNVYGFDSHEMTSVEPREFNIWRISRMWEMQCVASSFIGFINYIYSQEVLSEGTPPIMTFRPVRPTKKRK